MLNFINALEQYCQEKGLNYVDVYERAGIDKKHYSKIKANYYNNRSYIISRNAAIFLSLAAKPNLLEMQILLSYAGYVLSENIPYDRVVMNAIHNRDYNGTDLHIALNEAGLNK